MYFTTLSCTPRDRVKFWLHCAQHMSPCHTVVALHTSCTPPVVYPLHSLACEEVLVFAIGVKLLKDSICGLGSCQPQFLNVRAGHGSPYECLRPPMIKLMLSALQEEKQLLHEDMSG
jgi:hypothetical protein